MLRLNGIGRTAEEEEEEVGKKKKEKIHVKVKVSFYFFPFFLMCDFFNVSIIMKSFFFLRGARCA